jgi:plastocyanin
MVVFLLVASLAPATSVDAQATGAVEGVVTLRLQPPRRSAGRYPGGATAVHTVQSVPALVFIQGAVAGAPVSLPTSAPVMAQRDTAFVPAALIVPVGATVSFPNGDTFFHNVFSYSSSARFDLGRYPRGEAKSVTFDEPGIVKVYCEVHEFMRSVIAVVENPFHAVAGGDGRFRIDGIPEGTYTFVVWHPDLEPVEQRVQVVAGRTARLDAELR